MSSSENVFNWLPCSVVFVTSSHQGRRDIMTATAMFVSEKEPLLTISVAKGHLTEELIRSSGRFTVVIAGDRQKDLAVKVGSVKGAGTDKFAKFGIKTTGENLVPDGAAAWLDCTVESSQEIKGYRLFIGRVAGQSKLKTPPLVWHDNAFFKLSPA